MKTPTALDLFGNYDPESTKQSEVVDGVFTIPSSISKYFTGQKKKEDLTRNDDENNLCFTNNTKDLKL